MEISTQNKVLTNHFLNGMKISNREALIKFGIGRLASRIHDLRDKGLPVITEMVPNNSNGGRHAVYYIPACDIARVREMFN